MSVELAMAGSDFMTALMERRPPRPTVDESEGGLRFALVLYRVVRP